MLFRSEELSLDQPGPDTEVLARAACRWVREMVRINMGGCEQRRFRLFVWRPKGEQILCSGRFSCTDPEYEVEEAAPKPPNNPLAPTVQAPVTSECQPEARVWRSLGDGYTHLISLLQQSYSHLAVLQNTTISNQNTQNSRLQKVVEELVGELLKMRVGLAEVVQQGRQESGETRVREELGKQFISEIGTFGREIGRAHV